MTTTKTENKKNAAREEIGIVHSNKMQKTIVVSINRRFRHAKYGKFLSRTKRVKAHDEANEASIGDQVLLVAARPLSKEKRYVLKKILRKATGV